MELSRKAWLLLLPATIRAFVQDQPRSTGAGEFPAQTGFSPKPTGKALVGDLFETLLKRQFNSATCGINVCELRFSPLCQPVDRLD